MTRLVVDCSVALAWCFEDERDPVADATLNVIRNVHAVVPVIWPLELRNALLIGERRKRITAERTTRLLEELARLPIEVDTPPWSSAADRILSIAREGNLTAYDAAYVESRSASDVR